VGEIDYRDLKDVGQLSKAILQLVDIFEDTSPRHLRRTFPHEIFLKILLPVI
jgi:hypothetical protein